MSGKTLASWMPTAKRHLSLRQRRVNGIGKDPFECWHDR